MNTALSVREDAGLIAQDEILSPVMSLQLAKQRLKEFQEFVKEYLREGEDYGTIPGTPKPTLYKPGADKLCELYGLSDSYEIVDKVEDFSLTPPLFDYTIRCVLTRIRTQLPVSTGLGSCNSYEGRYRWREGQRLCPQCGKPAIIKGKEEYGGGWICFGKKGGCGAKFADNDSKITSQNIGRVENDDVATLKNTILKMAKKRAKVDGTLAATRSSGIFTQDIEDMQSTGDTTPSPQPAKKRGAVAAKPKAENVICADCGATNGHAASCKYSATKKSEQDAPALIKAAFHILAVEQKLAAKSNNAPYLVLDVVDPSNHQGKIYVWHKGLHEYLIPAKDKPILCEISEQKKGNLTYFQLEHLLEIAGVPFVDNKPAQQGTLPAQQVEEEF